MLLGDAVCYYAATAKLLFDLSVIFTECVDVGDNPPTRLVCSRDPCRIQNAPEIILMTNNNTNNLV